MKLQQIQDKEQQVRIINMYQNDKNAHEASSVSILNKSEKAALKKFHDKMDRLKYSLCPTYNKCFLSIVLVKGECRRCYSEKNSPKKFLSKNDMDPGEVPEELQGLTEIKEMLIARIF